MLNILSLPLLSGPLWPGVVVRVKVPCMGQIELFNHFLYLKPFNCMQTNNYWIELLVSHNNTWNKLTMSFGSFKNVTKRSFVYKSTNEPTQTKRLEKKIYGNRTRMLYTDQHKHLEATPHKQLLRGNLPPISQTIQVRRTRHAWHWCRSKGELISDVPQWTYQRLIYLCGHWMQ